MHAKVTFENGQPVLECFGQNQCRVDELDLEPTHKAPLIDGCTVAFGSRGWRRSWPKCAHTREFVYIARSLSAPSPMEAPPPPDDGDVDGDINRSSALAQSAGGGASSSSPRATPPHAHTSDRRPSTASGKRARFGPGGLEPLLLDTGFQQPHAPYPQLAPAHPPTRFQPPLRSHQPPPPLQQPQSQRPPPSLPQRHNALPPPPLPQPPHQLPPPPMAQPARPLPPQGAARVCVVCGEQYMPMVLGDRFRGSVLCLACNESATYF